MSGWWMATDCEGPLSLNDFAFELCQAYMPAGDKLFAVLSSYDDYLIEVEHRTGHPAGSTLRWVAPFLKAYGLTEDGARSFARKSLLLLPGTVQVLGILNDLMDVFIISASYRQYLEALCETVGMPANRAWATSFPLDSYSISPAEQTRLKEMAAEVAALQPLAWPEAAAAEEDLMPPHSQSVGLLQDMIAELESMEVAGLMREIEVVGGSGKAEVLGQIQRTSRKDVGKSMYIGDSITDVEALAMVRQAGGISVAYNANRYALAAGEIACLSPHAGGMLALGCSFADNGAKGVRDMVRDWPRSESSFASLFPETETLWKTGKVGFEFVSGPDIDGLIQRSEAFRRSVRGEAIGALG